MTPKMLIFTLCVSVMILAAICIGFGLFTRYLVDRCERFERDNKRMSKLIGALNERNENLENENNILIKEIKELKYE